MGGIVTEKDARKMADLYYDGAMLSGEMSMMEMDRAERTGGKLAQMTRQEWADATWHRHMPLPVNPK